MRCVRGSLRNFLNPPGEVFFAEEEVFFAAVGFDFVAFKRFFLAIDFLVSV